MNKQLRSPRKVDDRAEQYWDHLKARGSLRAALDEKVAQVPAPDWEALRAAGGSGHSRVSVPWPLFMVAAAACFVLAVWSVSGSPSRPSVASTSVVDQVFRSTAGGESPEVLAVKANAAFSPILKTIDAGFSHWDEPTPLEE